MELSVLCTLLRLLQVKQLRFNGTAVASMRRTEALASVKFYQILSIFIFFIRLIILEDFIRLISYNGPCVRLGCSFFLATALNGLKVKFDNYHQMVKNGFFTDTDLAKCIIMSAVGRFIICKVDRVMF